MNTLAQILSGIKNLLTWWVTVAPWEQCIRVRLGKRLKLLKAGIHLRLPVLDRVYIQSVRLRSTDFPIQTITTKDGHTVTVAGTMLYEIVDIMKLYTTLHHAEGVVVDMVASAISRTIHSLNREECSPQRVQDDATQQVELERYGINQTSIHITDFAFVKTYRLIMDHKSRNWDTFLDTIVEAKI